MEIDFNLSRIPKPELPQPIARTGSTPAAADPVHSELVSSTASLTAHINDMPLVRPEKVAAGKAQVSFTSYPPGELLDRIATLLAVHLKH
jgi:hypothetical protein